MKADRHQLVAAKMAFLNLFQIDWNKEYIQTKTKKLHENKET